jgi:hypothetical protein
LPEFSLRHDYSEQYCILMKMKDIFPSDAVIPGGTAALFFSICSGPVNSGLHTYQLLRLLWQNVPIFATS